MADEEEGEGCLHNLPNCDSQRKAESHHSVEGRLYVFISLGVVYLVFLDAVSRRYGKKHEEVDRH